VLDEVLKRFIELLDALPQVLGVSKSCVGDLEVLDKVLTEIRLVMYVVEWEVLELDPGRVCKEVGQVLNLDDKVVIVSTTHPACEAVILELDLRIHLPNVLGDVGCSPKVSWKVCASDVSFESVRP
jgi:hypothetical protein